MIFQVVGKALYDRQLVDFHLTQIMYKHLLGIPVNFDDLEAIDPMFHKSLTVTQALPAVLAHLMLSLCHLPLCSG